MTGGAGTGSVGGYIMEAFQINPAVQNPTHGINIRTVTGGTTFRIRLIRAPQRGTQMVDTVIVGIKERDMTGRTISIPANRCCCTAV